MRKSFTRLLSLVMLFGMICFYSYGAPTISNPALGDGATAVWPLGATAYTKTTDKAKITFKEAVVASTGSIRVLKDGTLVAVIKATDSKVTITGNVVEVDLSAYLAELSDINLTVDATAFKPADGTPAAYAEPVVWSWMTGDYTAPTLLSVDPDDGDVVGDNTIDLILTFKDASPIMAGTGSITVYKADGNVWDLKTLNFATGGNASLSGDVLTVSGIRQLEDATNYQVSIDAGVVTDDGKRADGVKNPFAGAARADWTFSSEDFTAPTYASGYPKKANVGSSTFDILVKTNESGKAYIYVSTSATVPAATFIRGNSEKSGNVTGGTEATFSFEGKTESQTYYAYVIVDNAHVDTEVVKTVEVKTGETQPPVLVNVMYDYKTSTDESASVASNIVPLNSDVEQDIKQIILTFNEEIKLGAGNIIIKRVLDNTVYKTIESTVMSVNSTNKKQLLVPITELENNVQYYVVVPNTLVTDIYTNKYAGISSNSGWRFNSSDEIAPKYSITPAHAAVNVADDKNIVLTFDEVVNVQASDFKLYYKPGNDEILIPFVLSVNNNDGKFTVATLNPVDPLPSSALVTLVVYENLIEDNGQPSNAVGLGKKSYSFFIEDTAGPVISSWTGSPLSSATAEIKITYNEGIYLLGGTPLTADNLFSIITVKVNNESGQNVPVNLSISDDKKVISIKPATAWTSEGKYYVAVTSDVEDAAGNPFVETGPRSKIYSIKDLVPEIVDINVADKIISTGDPITVKFKEGSNIEVRYKYYDNGAWTTYTGPSNMEKVFILKEGSANGPDVYFEVGGTNGDFTVDATLEGNKTYYLAVGPSTQDSALNVNVAKAVTFKTKYEGVPEVVSLSPVDGKVEVAKSSNFVITFNTGVQLKAGYSEEEVYFTTDGGVTKAQKVASGRISFNTAGDVVTIDPATDLSNDMAYDLVVGAGVFVNKNATSMGNAEIALGDWNFVTKDTKLDIASIAPDNVEDVEIDDKLVITFNEKAVAKTGYIDIKNFNTDGLIERIPVTAANVKVEYPTSSTTKVSITPTALFKYFTKYYVEVSAGAFEDIYGNKSKEIYGKTTANGVLDWTFKTADPALAIVKTTPADGADKIASGASIVVEFNREIAAGAGAVGYIEAGSTDQLQAYPIGSTNITINGKTLTITHPDKVFPANTEIFIYLEEGAVVAATNALIENALVNKTITPVSFHTGDVNPPVPTFDPENETEEVALDANITITFDEDIFHQVDGTVFTAGDITDDKVFQLYMAAWNSTLEIWAPTGLPIPFVGSITGKTVVMNPDVDLHEYTAYIVVINNHTVSGVADGVVDALGHETPQTFSVFFTADLTAPEVTLTATGGAKEVILSDINVTDDSEPNKFYYMVREKSTAAAPTAAEVKAANAKTMAEIAGNVVISGLNPSTTYEIFYVADDIFGNTSAVAKKEASTDDTVAPVLVSTDPASPAVNVEVEGGEITFELTFSEGVTVGSGAIVLREQSTQTIVATYDAATVLSGDDDDVIIMTLGGITATGVMNYYVEMAAGTVVDTMAGNEFAGIFGENAIYFSTEDNKVPTVTLDDNTLTTNQNIVLKFSENVQPGTATAILYKGDVEDPAAAVEVFPASAQAFNGTKVTLNPADDLDNEATYSVRVNVSFATDLSANKNANTSTWLTFTTTEDVAPYVLYLDSPGENPVNKDNMAHIDFDFNEAIYFSIDGIRTNIQLLTDAQIKANGLVTFVDEAGNSVPFTMYQCCDNDVVFTVDTDLLDHNSKYTVTIQGFTDNTGLVMSPYEYVFETTDGVRPTAIFDPADEEEDVHENSVLTITFNEQIYHWVGTYYGENPFYEVFDNNNVDEIVYLYNLDTEEYVPFDATFNGSNVITITPLEPLDPSTNYEYGYDPDYVYDIDDQEAEGDYYAQFKTRDNIIPEFNIADVAPVGTGVEPNALMYVIFSEHVKVSTGKVIIRNLDGTIFQAIGAEGLSIDSSNKKKLKIAHAPFAPNAEYFVELQASVITDESGNPNEAYVDAENGWKFTTKDTYSIEAEVSPLGDNQPDLVDLKLTFNKKVYENHDGVFGSFLAVYKEDGTAIAQIPVQNLVYVNNTVTYYNLQLEPDQAYYARVEPKSIKDGSNNLFAGIMDNSWSFSTMVSIAPVVTALSPADDASAVDPKTSFTMTFDRNIAAGTGKIAVRHSVDGTLFEEVDVTATTISANTLTFSLSKDLADYTGYYVIVPEGAVTNTEVTKDKFAGILNVYTWNFSTGSDITLPELISWTPQDTIEDNHPTFVMTFSEDVELTTAGGNLKVYPQGSTTAVITVPLTAAMISGNKVTVDYDATVHGSLDKNATYYVLVDGGALADAAGNEFGGVSGVAAWVFTTGTDFKTIIEDIVTVNFKVYPNPFNDRIMIDNNDKLTRVIVSNIAGQRVLDIEYPGHEIRTANLVSGVYIISLYTEDGRAKTERMIKR